MTNDAIGPADVGKKGGTSEYIKDGPKSGAVRKRSFPGPPEDEIIQRRISLTTGADNLATQLSVVMGTTKAEVVDTAIRLYGLAYSHAVRLFDARPTLERLLALFFYDDFPDD